MEPLKKAQVEGFLMFAEPEVLFGNIDELCSVSKKWDIFWYIFKHCEIDCFFKVTHSFCKEFLQGLLTHLDADGDLNVIDLLRRLFESRGSKARILSQAYHRYALNYINALNYLETLRRQNDFCDFEKVLTSLKTSRDYECTHCGKHTILVKKVFFFWNNLF